MCGIVGQLLGNGDSVDKERLESATKLLLSRGPDDEGYWLEPGAGFGQKRLAILDISPAGHQPMCSQEGRYIIVFNGEIYNFRELRTQLDAFWPKWTSDSDTEVILAAYSRWGTDCLSKFQGMFALAIWDRSERILFAARDRMGVKPLYYHHSESSFSFASRPRSLHALQKLLSTELDTQALRYYLEIGYIPAPFTIHCSVRKLPPAHYLIFNAKQGDLTIERYWQFQGIAPEKTWERRPEEDLLDELDDIVSRCVRSRMVSDVPIGAFLSGGIDSSLVVAMMARHSPVKVKTFSIGFDEKRYDESSHAAAVAEALGTEHYCEQLRVDDLLALFPIFMKEFDEPFFDCSAFPTMAVSRLARRYVTVSLSGDGGDELFGGYHYYDIMQKLSMAFSAPPSLRKLASLMLGMIPNHQAKLLSGALAQPDEAAAFAFSRSIAKDFVGVLDEGVVNQTESIRTLFSYASGGFPAGLESSEAAMRLDALYTLPDDYMQKVDLASMAFSLEARDPLLDHELVEWAMRLPVSWKIRGGANKYLLRKLAYRYVPKKLLDRPKQGFGVPIDDWLRGPLKAWAEEMIYDISIYSSLPLVQERVIELWKTHLSGKRNAHPFLWAILMLMEFSRKFPLSWSGKSQFST